MLAGFKEAIAPLVKKQDETLNIKHIEVKYIPSEVTSHYRYKQFNTVTKKTKYGFQFMTFGRDV